MRKWRGSYQQKWEGCTYQKEKGALIKRGMGSSYKGVRTKEKGHLTYVQKIGGTVPLHLPPPRSSSSVLAIWKLSQNRAHYYYFFNFLFHLADTNARVFMIYFIDHIVVTSPHARIWYAFVMLFVRRTCIIKCVRYARHLFEIYEEVDVEVRIWWFLLMWM